MNLDPAETVPSNDSAETRRAEFEKALSPTPVVFAEDPDDLSSTFEWLRQGTSLWQLFLTIVLVALVFETLVSNYLGPKQDEQQAAAGSAAHPLRPSQPEPGVGRFGVRRFIAAFHTA